MAQSMETFPEIGRAAVMPLYPRDNKTAEWPLAGNGTEA
jgi:hypothetical protein